MFEPLLTSVVQIILRECFLVDWKNLEKASTSSGIPPSMHNAVPHGSRHHDFVTHLVNAKSSSMEEEEERTKIAIVGKKSSIFLQETIQKINLSKINRASMNYQ